LNRSYGLTFALILLLAATVFAAGEEPPVPVTAYWSTSAVPAGGKAELGVLFDVPKGYHITDVDNGLFFVNARDTLGLKFDSAQYPAGVKYKGDRVYQGKVLVRVPVTITEQAATGSISFPLDIGYQICQEFGTETCFLPNERDIIAAASVVPKGTSVLAANQNIFAPAATSSPAGGGSLEERLTAALDKGSWLAFLLVFVGGILCSFTPCVYPVIPITIGYIGGSSKGKPLRGLGLSAIYVLGIAVIYSSLGLISAATGTLFGAFSGSIWVTGFVALIFVVMGFSMLGAFDISLPSSLTSKMQGSKKGGGLLGPLVIGMISGLVMAPCVGPVIVALLAWVSKTGSLLYGWSLLFVFSLGLGLLFLVIGTFAGAIQALPRAGAWMDGVKHGFGWILLAAALFLMRFMIPQPYYSLAWAVMLIVFAVFTGAFDTLTSDDGAGKRLWKSVTLMAFLVAALLLFKTFLPISGGSPETSKAAMSWIVNDESKALSDASSLNKPLLVDVYADWCAACVELDHKTYSVPTVQQRTDGFVRLKLDFTKDTPWVKQMQEKYRITGMPTVMLFKPSGEEITRFTGFKSAGDFVSLLDQNNL
jgi:thioredoxin:protein disulfide reductase